MENKSTGIIRRIDDLGRVVIPKEIRRQLHIYEGDPFEIFVTDNGVEFRKYSIGEYMSKDIDLHVDALQKAARKYDIEGAYHFCDRNGFIFGRSKKMDPTDTSEIYELWNSRKPFSKKIDKDMARLYFTVFSSGDFIGVLVIHCNNPAQAEKIEMLGSVTAQSLSNLFRE